MRFSTSQQGTVTVFAVEGAMIATDLKLLAETMTQKIGRGQPQMLIDMMAVPALDSAALELLADSQEGCRKRGGVIKLTGLNPLCREIFTVTRLERRFEFFDNQLTALGSFAT